MRWHGRYILSMADQGFWSLSQLALQITIARGLGISQYGQWGVAVALVALATAAHTALITEPLLTFGGPHGEAPIARQAYGKLHLRLVLLTTTLMTMTAWAIQGPKPAAAAAVWAAALMTPGILTAWLCRREALAAMRPGLAATLGVTLLVLAPGLAWSVIHLASGDLLEVAAVMGVATLSIGLILRRRLSRIDDAGNDLTRAYRYARFAAPTYAFAWVPLSLPLVLLGAGDHFLPAGELRLAILVAMPALQAASAIGAMLLVNLSGRAPGQKRTEALRSLTLVWLVTMVGGTVLVALAGPIGTLLGHAGWRTGEPLVLLMAVITLFEGTNYVMASTLRSHGRLVGLLTAQGAGAVATVLAGLLLGHDRAMAAGWAMLAGTATFTTAQLFRIRGLWSQRRDG